MPNVCLIHFSETLRFKYKKTDPLFLNAFIWVVGNGQNAFSSKSLIKEILTVLLVMKWFLEINILKYLNANKLEEDTLYYLLCTFGFKMK